MNESQKYWMYARTGGRGRVNSKVYRGVQGREGLKCADFGRAYFMDGPLNKKQDKESQDFITIPKL